jgi:hypothetical protein
VDVIVDVEVGTLDGSDTDEETGEWVSTRGALGVTDGAIGAFVDATTGDKVGDLVGS